MKAFYIEPTLQMIMVSAPDVLTESKPSLELPEIDVS